MLNNFTKKYPPYHVIQEDVSTPLERLEVEKIIGHQSVCSRVGVIAVMYETLDGTLSPILGTGNGPRILSRWQILLYGVSTPRQHRQANRLYRRMRIGGAQWELSRHSGERFLALGYGCVTCAG